MVSQFQQFIVNDSDDDSSETPFQQSQQSRNQEVPVNSTPNIEVLNSVTNLSHHSKALSSSISFHMTSGQASGQPTAANMTKVRSVANSSFDRESHTKQRQRSSTPHQQLAPRGEYPTESPMPVVSAPPASVTPQSVRASSRYASVFSTPVQYDYALSSTKSTSEAGDGSRRKVVRKRVVVRRRKDDPTDPGEVVHVEETSRPVVPPIPLPPRRVSPQARRAAESRSTSAQVTPRAFLDARPPQIPARTQQTPRSLANATPTPRSSRAQAQESQLPNAPRVPTPAERARVAESLRSQQESLQFQQHSIRSQQESLHFDQESEQQNETNQTESLAFFTDDSPGITHRSPADAKETPRRAAPQIPSPSALESLVTPYSIDDDGNVVAHHRAAVRETVLPDGRVAWVYVPSHHDADDVRVLEIGAPPKRLSQRAQDILAAKRRTVEEAAKARHAEQVRLAKEAEAEVKEEESTADEATENVARKAKDAKETKAMKHAAAVRAKAVHRQSSQVFVCTFPSDAFSGDHVNQAHGVANLEAGCEGWNKQACDAYPAYQRTLQQVQASMPEMCYNAEQLVRVLQPIQTTAEQAKGAGDGKACGCANYSFARGATLNDLLTSHHALEEGFKRYLNLQPMQLANVAVEDMVESELVSPSSRNRRPSAHDVDRTAAVPKQNPQRGIATLGGLWCIAEPLREDGRPLGQRGKSKGVRRVMRVCGGQAIGLPLCEGERTLDVRCYELMLFSQEATGPSAVNYGSSNTILGQLVPPQASTFSLTPRVIDTPALLKEYKKKLLSTTSREAIMENTEEDRATFYGHGDGAADTAPRFLTLTLVTISVHQKYTVDLTLVLLPFRTDSTSGGKTLAEIPRFCPATVAAHRKLLAMSLSFSTKSSFMSAYKALLWASECNIIEIEQLRNASTASSGMGKYVNLRVSATTSPLLPWSSSLGSDDTSASTSPTSFHGQCLDYAVVALGTAPLNGPPREPLRLDDFVLAEVAKSADGGQVGDDDDTASRPLSAREQQRQRRRSSIFTSTLTPHTGREADASAADASNDPGASSTVVALTPFGVVRRAINQKTGEVFDVRVLPRNRARMLPGFSELNAADRGGKLQEEFVLQQDVEAAIMMEYVSQLPFLSRVYGVLVDEQRYYVFQEPVMSAVALEQSMAGSVERAAIEYNTMLKGITESSSVMSLKDFMHAILHSSIPNRAGVAREEPRLQLAQVLAGQLLLLLTSIHGKGMLLGPCPPQRILVRTEAPGSAVAAAGDGDTSDHDNDNDADGAATERQRRRGIASSHVQLFIPDIGVNTNSWSYERQQCGVLEYLSPSFIFEHMLDEDTGRESRPWTMHDDWWTYLCICFELFATDGTALLSPPKAVQAPLPMLSKFASPVDILDAWRDVVVDDRVPPAGTAQGTLCKRVRSYVRRRVLESVAPLIDGWVMSKSEELELFGTTAARGKRTRAAPIENSTSTMIGVSLSSMHPRLVQSDPTTEASSLRYKMEEEEDRIIGKPGGAAVSHNILEEMPWVLSYRSFFDSALDAAFPSESSGTGGLRCAVHGPALRLLSHPFFAGVNLAQLFDGAYALPRAASIFCRRYLSKAKVREALMVHRSRAYRGPMARRADAPLMITNSAFNTGGGGGTAALLLLSTREGPTDGENELINTPAESPMSPGASVPRETASSPNAQQLRLRSMYNTDELQEISRLENDVRGALYTHQTKDDSFGAVFVASSRHGDNHSHHGSSHTSRSYESVLAPSRDDLEDKAFAHAGNASTYAKTDTHPYVAQQSESRQREQERDVRPASQEGHRSSHRASTVGSNRGHPERQRSRRESDYEEVGHGHQRRDSSRHSHRSSPLDRSAAMSSPSIRTGHRRHHRGDEHSHHSGVVSRGSPHTARSPAPSSNTHGEHYDVTSQSASERNRRLSDPMPPQFDRPAIDQTVSEARSRARDRGGVHNMDMMHVPEPRRTRSVDSSNAANSLVLVASDDDDIAFAEVENASSTTYTSNINIMHRKRVTPRNRDHRQDRQSTSIRTPHSQLGYSAATSELIFEF